VREECPPGGPVTGSSELSGAAPVSWAGTRAAAKGGADQIKIPIGKTGIGRPTNVVGSSAEYQGLLAADPVRVAAHHGVE
jgi:hypothetical protein